MRSGFLSAILFALIGSWAATPLFAAAPADEAAVNERLAEFDGSRPGVVVGVVRHGELVYARAVGMADLRFEVPFEIDTPTNIGSTAKQFTGMALALLHVRGELSLDDDVRKYLPGLPDFGETVTLRHLASHTSGYREFLNTLAIAGIRLDKGDWMTRRDVLAVVEHQPALQNRPGEEWNYNNTGYALLAQVIAKVTGKPFDQWVRGEIFQPLGMNATRYRLAPDRIVPGASTGYGRLPDDEGYLEVRDLGAALGAGALYTTIGDMARWMIELGRFELGGERVRALMTTPYELGNGESTDYGLGLFIDQWRGLVRWQHGGGDAGHRSVFHYYPEIDSGIMVFSNHHEIDDAFTRALAEAFLGDHLEAPESNDAGTGETAAPTDEPFSDDLFDRYIGRFELEIAPGFVLNFFRDGERYMTQATGQPAVEITPVSATGFELVGVDARIVFDIDDDGHAGSLTLFQNGEHRAVRLDEDEGGAVNLEPYLGRYFSAELETFYVVESKDDKLVLRHRRLDPIILQHAVGDQFGGGFPVARLEFLRDDAGKVTGMQAGNGRARDIHFERVE
ncbi:MAG: beta-lactamase family protein [Pseudomonadota bacterium]|nr:MAG: beta-lactamase family protein [Pseudomonadota bacterium]